MSKILAAFIAAALVAVATPTTAVAAPPDNPKVFYPESYGGLAPVVAGDGIADNSALQSAITAAGAVGGHVVLTQMYDVETRTAKLIGNPWRTFAIVVTGNTQPVMIRAEAGGGLRAIGDWGTGTQSLLAVHKNGNTVTLRDLFIDMSQRGGGDEQQHAVQLDYGAKHVRIEDVTIFHPSLGPSRGGDCVRMVGGYNTADLVEDVNIRGLVGLACDRSLLSFQRSVRGVTADHLVSFMADDNDIDMEATGVDLNDDMTWIHDVTIRSALIVKGGGNGITLGRGYRIRVLDSSVIGGGVFSVSCRDCIVANSTFLQGSAVVDSPIGVIRSTERLKILFNRVGRLAGSTSTYPLIYVTANNGWAPVDTLVMGNDLAVSYNMPALRADNADLTVIGNTFRYTTAGPATANAIALVADSFTVGLPSSLVASSNRFLGPWWAAIRVAGKVSTNTPSGPVVVSGNVFDGARAALRCEGLTPNVVRAGNWKPAAMLDECPAATAGY